MLSGSWRRPTSEAVSSMLRTEVNGPLDPLGEYDAKAPTVRK